MCSSVFSVEDVFTYFHLENQQNIILPGVPKLLHARVKPETKLWMMRVIIKVADLEIALNLSSLADSAFSSSH